MSNWFTLTQIDCFHERTTLMDLRFYGQSCTRQADVYRRCDLLTKQQDWPHKNLIQKKHTWKQFDTSRSTWHASCLSRETPHLPFSKSKVRRRTRMSPNWRNAYMQFWGLSLAFPLKTCCLYYKAINMMITNNERSFRNQRRLVPSIKIELTLFAQVHTCQSSQSDITRWVCKIDVYVLLFLRLW
jgi:hypothetical protein